MRWRALIALMLAAQLARADGSVEAPLREYFAGEQAEGYAWFALGAPALAVGGALVGRSDDLSRGLSYPLLAFGAIQLLAGLWLLGVTEGRVERYHRAIVAGEPVREREQARLRGLDRSFAILKWSEVGLLVAGAATAVAGLATGRDLATGIGIAVAVESAIMLILDGLAARRARRYAAALAF